MMSWVSPVSSIKILCFEFFRSGLPGLIFFHCTHAHTHTYTHAQIRTHAWLHPHTRKHRHTGARMCAWERWRVYMCVSMCVRVCVWAQGTVFSPVFWFVFSLAADVRVVMQLSVKNIGLFWGDLRRYSSPSQTLLLSRTNLKVVLLARILTTELCRYYMSEEGTILWYP